MSCINNLFNIATGHIYLPIAFKIIFILVYFILVLLYFNYRIVYWSLFIKGMSNLVKLISINVVFFCFCYYIYQLFYSHKVSLSYLESNIHIKISDKKKFIVHNLFENIFCNWQVVLFLARKYFSSIFDNKYYL